MRKVIILGAGGRAFHAFNVVYRDDPRYEVVAFVPGADGDRYPSSLAGTRYPGGIPIHAEADFAELVRTNDVDEVVLADADISHEEVMHKASIALAAGADFSLLAPRSTMLKSPKPVVAVCGLRCASGTSQTSGRVAEILAQARVDADVVLWEGGNDVPLYAPDLLIVVVDPLRAGHELKYHPGETNLRMADVVVVDNVAGAGLGDIERVLTDVAAVNPAATIVKTAFLVTLEPGPSLMDAAVVVVEDGPAITQDGIPFGAATVAARAAMVGMRIDPRPYAVGSIAETFEHYPHLGSVLPAMGSSDEQLCELEQTLNAIDCDAVIAATPIDLGRLITCRHPIRRASYELHELGEPSLADVLAPIVARAKGELAAVNVA